MKWLLCTDLHFIPTVGAFRSSVLCVNRLGFHANTSENLRIFTQAHKFIKYEMAPAAS